MPMTTSEKLRRILQQHPGEVFTSETLARRSGANRSAIAGHLHSSLVRGDVERVKPGHFRWVGPVNGNGSTEPTVEPSDDRLPCSNCTRTFATPQSLGRHMQAVHGVPGTARKGRNRVAAASRARPTIVEPAEDNDSVERESIASVLYEPLSTLADGGTLLRSASGELLVAYPADIRPRSELSST